jgi:transcription elongation GreA/GreB family factor
MSDKRILITENDMKRLQSLLEATRSGEPEDKRNAEILAKKLAHAKVVRSMRIPDDVVTMNSWIQLLHLESSEKRECYLRFSTNESSSVKAVSVLTGLGVALLGSGEGDVIEWSGPSGTRRSKVVEIVYQPERLGNYEL